MNPRRYTRMTELHRFSLRIAMDADDLRKKDPEVAALMDGYAYGLWKLAELPNPGRPATLPTDPAEPKPGRHEVGDVVKIQTCDYHAGLFGEVTKVDRAPVEDGTGWDILWLDIVGPAAFIRTCSQFGHEIKEGK